MAGFPLSFAAPLLTVREVAAFLRVSARTVYTLCDQGRLAHLRVMNAIRVEPAALLALAQGPSRSRNARGVTISRVKATLADRAPVTDGYALLVDELLHALEGYAQELAGVTSPNAFRLELASCQS